MSILSSHRLLLFAWGVAFLCTRLSGELASAVNSLVWLVCLALLLRVQPQVMTLRCGWGAFAAMGLMMLWVVDSYGVVDPHSAVGWVLGWCAPIIAGFAMNRVSAERPSVYQGVAWMGAAVATGTLLVAVQGVARPTFLFTNPNVTAAVLVGCLPFSFACRVPRMRWALAVMMVLGIAATGSRGGMLSALAMIAGWASVRRADKRVWLVAALAGLLMAPFAVQRVQRLVDDPYAHGRAVWWRAALRVSERHPDGVGTRQFGWYGLRQRDEIKAPVYRYLRGQAGESAHSEWMQLWVDHGPWSVGLLLLALWGALSARPWRLEHAGLLGLLVHAAVDGTWQSEMVRILLLVHAMALWRQSRRWAVPVAPLWAGVVLVGLATVTLPTGLAQVFERQALRADRLSARQNTHEASTLERLARAARWSPLDPQPWKHQARVLRRAKDWAAAGQAIEQAVVRAPARPALRRQAAQLYAQAARAEPSSRVAYLLRSLHHHRVVIRLQAMHAVDRFNYAEVALALGFVERARKQLHLAVKLEPNYRVAWLALALVEPTQSDAHRRAAQSVKTRIIDRYCQGSPKGCTIQMKRVMTRLELTLVGSVSETRVEDDFEQRFGTWPQVPLVAWPGE
jgi:tetratricopeptide (TPR) repeat protein